jgi:CRISPR-associated endonuclease/helicase Cas3
MAEFPSFDSFYQAVNGREPFPWQSRLATEVQRSGWPGAIGVPTGLGKTSCLDVAVWAMAAEHAVPPPNRVVPTRVWWVVNRRLLVDAAFDHGKALARLLAHPSASAHPRREAALAAVAAGLSARQGGAEADALHVVRLRGGTELGARPADPTQPALVFSTVPMFASRWLFRGIGSSTTMRSVDAALAGIDSLVLLDEAHLARPLADLAEPVAQCDVGDPSQVLSASRSRPVFVRLSATGEENAFTLDEADLAHPVIRRRLDASKPVRLVETTKNNIARALIKVVVDLLAARERLAAVVFTNSPRTAREVFDGLRGQTQSAHGHLEADVLLLTGRVREREATGIRALVLDPATGAPAGGPRPSARHRHLVVVATQTLEVGADLDFDVVVTEACGARALVQRLGRLNRFGECDDAAGAVVFARDQEQFGIYGEEPRTVWERLVARAADGVVQMGPRVVGEAVGPPGDSPSRVGELLPAHLWEWAKTTTPSPGEAPPELFYEGFDVTDATVSVLWRAVIPENDTELRPSAVADEAVEVPICETREALSELTAGSVVRLSPNRVTVEHSVPLDRLRPGDVIILRSDVGGYDPFGWSPGSRDVVFDVSLLRPPGIPLVSDALEQLFASGDMLAEALQLARYLEEAPEPDEELDRPRLLDELVERLHQAGPSERLDQAEWDDLRSRLHTDSIYLPDDKGRLLLRPKSHEIQVVALRSDVFDELSFSASSIDLTEHLGSVGELASRLARHLGVTPSLIDAVAAAGRYHDLGKVDQRFQRWLDPHGNAPQPVAKSSTPPARWQRDRVAAGWPAGGRHEELSRRLVQSYLVTHGDPPWDPDLVLHLVVSHHGFGRPLVPGAPDRLPVTVEAKLAGQHVQASGDLSVVDWDQPARFRRCCERYGYWGLALLEALVRQADHQVSRVAVA